MDAKRLRNKDIHTLDSIFKSAKEVEKPRVIYSRK
jgi:hypothetical protein